MTGAPPNIAVARSKLIAPGLPDGLVVRQRLVERLSEPARFTLVEAVGGYGKTVAVRHWYDTVPGPVAWLTLDILDAEAGAFWMHVVEAFRSVVDSIDDEPARLLVERGADDTVFLRSLVTQIEEVVAPVVLVLDGMHDRLDRSVLDGINVLVERVGHVVSIVATCRSSPRLPLVRWRSAGWLREVRELDLRFTDVEAIAVADMGSTQFDPIEIAAYNHRIEGWPIGIAMAVAMGRADVETGTAPSSFTTTTDPTLADQLLNDLLDSVPGSEQDAAMSLSILEWFDPDIALELLGPDAPRAIRSLIALRFPLTVTDARTGVMRLQPLLRELLELRLSVSDPGRHRDLHRRAATLASSRGDLRAAHRHLAAIGAGAEFHDLLVAPALDLIDRGDIGGLRRFARQLPDPRDVADPELAAELAIVALHASGTSAAQDWSARAEVISGPRDDLRRRLSEVRCAISLLDADLDGVVDVVTLARGRRAADESDRSDSRIGRRFPIVAARALLAARHPDALTWIREAEHIEGPEIVREVTVPTLRAWHEWIFGRLDTATALSGRAVSWMDEHRIGAHHLAFDALITAGWCRLSLGDIAPATDLAGRAMDDASVLDCAWTSLQAGFLSARLAIMHGDHGTALRIVEDLRSTTDLDRCRSYAERVLALEVEALAGIGRLDDLDRRLGGFSPSPRKSLLLARFGRLEPTDVAAALVPHDAWPTLERIQAQLLVAATSDESGQRAVATVLGEAALTGWVLPFMGLGPEVDDLMRRVGVDRLHPRLSRALEQQPGPVEMPVPVVWSGDVPSFHLTPRELTLLELLPTHLSYNEMGTRLFLSVNTVKTNLKSLYRKLDASTRTEAVEAGERAGYL